MKILFSHKDGRRAISAQLSDDKLKLFLSVSVTGEARDFSIEELESAIRSKAPKANFDHAVLKDIVHDLNNGKSCQDRRIAKGTEPVPGRDGRLLWLVRKMGVRSEDSADAQRRWTEEASFESVVPNQPILRIYRPKPGTDGVDALGQPIRAAAGAEMRVQLDLSSVTIEPDNEGGFDVVRSLEGGFAFQDGPKIGVRIELDIRSDLDFHVGSISFIGRVRIQGDVHKNFSIRAEQGIHIQGSTYGGNVIAGRDGVRIDGVHYGGDGGSAVADRWYIARVARDITVDVTGPLAIEKEATECRLFTRHGVYAEKATIFGGEIRTVLGVSALKLGSPAATSTRIVLCSGLDASVQYQRTREEIVKHEEALKLLKLHLGPFATTPAAVGRLNQPLRGRMEALAAKLTQVEKSIDLLRLKASQLAATTTMTEGIVSFSDVLHPGVEVLFQQFRWTSNDPIAGPKTLSFVPGTEQWILGEYKSLPIIECAIGTFERLEKKRSAKPTAGH
jgi:uncharacterized protein (DUF342 family)